MSEKKVEIVQRAYEFINAAFRAHEFPEEQARAILHPEVRIDVSRNVFNPAVHDGIEGARRMFEGLWDVWHEFELVPRELLAEGDKVAIRLEMRGRGRDGIEVAREVGNLYTFRGDRLIEMVGGMEWDEAREALAEEAG
jgi:hypothetical protein